MYLRFSATRGHQKKFRCDFRNIQVQIRRTRYENWKNLKIRQNCTWAALLILWTHFIHWILFSYSMAAGRWTATALLILSWFKMRSKSYANTFHQIKPVSHVCIYNHVTIHVTFSYFRRKFRRRWKWRSPIENVILRRLTVSSDAL